MRPFGVQSYKNYPNKQSFSFCYFRAAIYFTAFLRIINFSRSKMEVSFRPTPAGSPKNKASDNEV